MTHDQSLAERIRKTIARAKDRRFYQEALERRNRALEAVETARSTQGLHRARQRAREATHAVLEKEIGK